MNKPSDYKTIEDLEKGVKKYDNRCVRATKSMYASTGILGLALLLGLPISLIAQIPILTIVSTIVAGVSVVSQVGFFALGVINNDKSMDLKSEKEKRESIQKNETSNLNLNVDKTNSSNKTKNKQRLIDKMAKNDTSLDVEL